MSETMMQNELALVCAAREGDQAAIDQLLRSHWTWLKGLIYGIVAGSQDLDDVLQDVCIRVISKIHTLREPERFRAWLAILARREALKHYRRRKQTFAVADEPLQPRRQDPESADPLEQIERRELHDRILAAVAELPERYREVFMLAHSGELTYAQMAEVLGVPITTMQIRLVRARRMIQHQVFGSSKNKVHER
jgi:RNA polymerase sigma factor (sigma-70 family)